MMGHTNSPKLAVGTAGPEDTDSELDSKRFKLSAGRANLDLEKEQTLMFGLKLAAESPEPFRFGP